MDKITVQSKFALSPKTLGFLAYLYLSLIIIAGLVYGPSPLLYGLFAILAGLFILPDRQFLGLCLIAGLTMVFERQFTLSGLVMDKAVYKLYLLDLVLIFSFLATAISQLRKRTKILFGWPEILLGVFMALVTIYLTVSLFDINAEFAVAFSSFKNYFFYPLIYFLVILIIDSREKLKGFINLLLLVAVGLIGFIAIGFLNGAGLWTEFTPLSTGGVRYLAGTHALYMLFALLIAAALLFHNRIRSPFLAIGIMAFWSLGIGASLMRHLWLALAVGLATLLILMEKPARISLKNYAVKIFLAVGSLAVVAIMFFSLTFYSADYSSLSRTASSFGDRLISLTDLSADISASWRTDLWRDAQNLWKENPAFGIGLGKSLLIDWGEYKNFEEIRNIHNSPLSIMVQMGLVGLASWLAFIVAVFWFCRNSIYLDDDLKPYYLGIASGIAAFLIASLFQPYLETNLLGLWLWLFLGLLRTSVNLAQKNYADTSNQ